MVTMKKSLIPICLAFTMFLSSSADSCLAKGEEAFKQGLESYKARDYKEAVKQLSQAIKEGKRTPSCYLYLAGSYHGAGHKGNAIKLYKQILTSYKGSAAAKRAELALASLDPAFKSLSQPQAKQNTPVSEPNATGLLARISVTPPKMGHKPVSKASINAVKNAVKSLPPQIRQELDEYGASISLSPNMIDKWPDSVKTLPENNPAPTLAELPGRIYGKEMNIYERKKVRGSTALSRPRPPHELRHTTFNQCVQIVDDILVISKDPEFRKVYNSEKKRVPASYQVKLATFLKNDDWGPKETCAEICAALLGGGDEYTQGLYRCFPRTKEWLRKRLEI